MKVFNLVTETLPSYIKAATNKGKTPSLAGLIAFSKVGLSEEVLADLKQLDTDSTKVAVTMAAVGNIVVKKSILDFLDGAEKHMYDEVSSYILKYVAAGKTVEEESEHSTSEEDMVKALFDDEEDGNSVTDRALSTIAAMIPSLKAIKADTPIFGDEKLIEELNIKLARKNGIVAIYGKKGVGKKS